MRIYGIDFTSSPSSKKAITYAQCTLSEDDLFLEHVGYLTSFDEFESFLRGPGPWVAGMDFPFGQDGSGDLLDALLCAIQAGWAYSQRDQNFGIPGDGGWRNLKVVLL